MDYEQIVSDFYGEITGTIAGYLDQGQDVAVIAEGDPFFYGSFMYIHDRLAETYETTVVPGVCSVLGASAVLGAPLVYRNQTLSILSGVMEADELKRRLADTGAAAIMKLGKNLDKVRDVLTDLGLMDRALYVERATMANQRIVPLSDVSGSDCPYFSIILVPGQKWNGA
jgi:precorrin-2/cobalt-factor-2 C20-methyltransferase